jgi:hypothetical protein
MQPTNSYPGNGKGFRREGCKVKKPRYKIEVKPQVCLLDDVLIIDEQPADKRQRLRGN